MASVVATKRCQKAENQHACSGSATAFAPGNLLGPISSVALIPDSEPPSRQKQAYNRSTVRTDLSTTMTTTLEDSQDHANWAAMIPGGIRPGNSGHYGMGFVWARASQVDSQPGPARAGPGSQQLEQCVFDQPMV